MQGHLMPGVGSVGLHSITRTTYTDDAGRGSHIPRLVLEAPHQQLRDTDCIHIRV